MDVSILGWNTIRSAAVEGLKAFTDVPIVIFGAATELAIKGTLGIATNLRRASED
jgi:hypothetical protein